MSDGLTRDVADPSRKTFVDTGPEVALLVSMVTATIHPAASSTLRSDPLYVDRINAWWADAGSRLGFRWTTVSDLSFRDANGIEVEAVWGRMSNARQIMFTAEAEPEAIDWKASAEARMRANVALVKEIAELRALITESAPIVRYCETFAGFDDDGLGAFADVHANAHGIGTTPRGAIHSALTEVRDTMRRRFATETAYNPRLYTEAQETAAMEIFWAALKRVEDGEFLPWAAGVADLTKIAAALGMHRGDTTEAAPDNPTKAGNGPTIKLSGLPGMADGTYVLAGKIGERS